jgi:hypothetical protein
VLLEFWLPKKWLHVPEAASVTIIATAIAAICAVLLLLECYMYQHLLSCRGKPSFARKPWGLFVGLKRLCFSLSFLEAETISKQFSCNENIIFLTLSS